MSSYDSRYGRSSSLNNGLKRTNSSDYLNSCSNHNIRLNNSNSYYTNHYHGTNAHHNSRLNSHGSSSCGSNTSISLSKHREKNDRRSLSPHYRGSSRRSSINYERDEEAIKNSRKYDDPPYSRCFILCSKDTTEQELDRVFQKYGRIQDIWIVKDHQTKIGKGIAYIKYSRASEAARAVEEMSGKYLNDRHQRPVKVFISGCKNQIDRNQPNGEIYDRMMRLIVMVNKKFTKYDLKNVFSVS
jgi:RNA recognition motif-containing protein